MQRVLGVEPLAYLTKIIQGKVARGELCNEGKVLGVSDQDEPRAGGLQCNVCLV